MKARKVCNGELLYYNTENGVPVNTGQSVGRTGFLCDCNNSPLFYVENRYANKGRHYNTSLVMRDSKGKIITGSIPFGFSHTSLEDAAETCLNLIRFLQSLKDGVTVVEY